MWALDSPQSELRLRSYEVLNTRDQSMNKTSTNKSLEAKLKAPSGRLRLPQKKTYIQPKNNGSSFPQRENVFCGTRFHKRKAQRGKHASTYPRGKVLGHWRVGPTGARPLPPARLIPRVKQRQSRGGATRGPACSGPAEGTGGTVAANRTHPEGLRPPGRRGKEGRGGAMESTGSFGRRGSSAMRPLRRGGKWVGRLIETRGRQWTWRGG